MSIRTPNDKGLTLVRIAVALILGIHGFARAFSHGVAPFGDWLNSLGFPAGPVIAWAITVFEMISVFPLAAGRWVRLLVPGHMTILLGGITLIHWHEGWFVVGAGRNGMEFSVLLLACLAGLFIAGDQNRPVEPRT